MKEGKWNKLIKYINSIEIGEIITRRQLLKLIYNDPCYRGSGYGTTVDQYRRILSMIGILDIEENGVYKVLHHIRPNALASEVKEVAYSGDVYREWFHDFIIN